MYDDVFLTAELTALRQQTNALIARVRAGDDSIYLRGRIDRIQAVMMALGGCPEVLSA